MNTTTASTQSDPGSIRVSRVTGRFARAGVGIGLAAVLARRSRQARGLFIRTTVALTAISLVAPLLVSAGGSTRVVLELTHVLAAAIVIPAIAARLPD